MRIMYFRSAWGDIKNSPGWFGKLSLLALLSLIPIFGQIVICAYLYGWAREIAWGTHEPLPPKIFSNDDGKFWRRGWFVLVISFVFSLIPYVVVVLGDVFQGIGMGGMAAGGRGPMNPAVVGLGSVLGLVGFVGMLVAVAFAWIGSMRMAIYDRLSAGFQFGKIWKMLRHDTGGILRIYGMDLLVSFVLVMIWYLLFFLLVAVVVAIGVAGAMSAGYSLETLQNGADATQLAVVAQVFLAAGALGVVAMIAAAFALSLVSVFVQMLVVRALGYWTMQYEVPRWTGQDDPMPFELYQQQAQIPVYQAQQQYGQQQYQAQQQYAQQQYGQQQYQYPAQQYPVQPQQPQQAQPSAQQQPAVTYDEPAVVGAEFIMSPETIGQLKTEISEQRAELEAQGAHGVQDGQAGDADVGEDGQPHIGESEGGQP